jgi:putative membrane-bound dehydrogenase-like protein
MFAVRRCQWIVLTVTLLLGGGRPPLFGQGTTGITVPDGFTVEIAAASPLVQHPLMAGFDDRGRLYVAESAGLNLDAAELLTQKPNYIRRLEDTDGDGKFDHTTIFADQMTFPSGALWHQGALYVASPPHIWRLEDTDDDGVADRREAIVGKFGFVGNAADIHGCFLGPNGRLYWCDGRHGHEFVDEQGHVRSQGKAARIFSCRIDGSDIESHCGGGMDNPVEVDFSAEGEMLGSVNLFYEKRGDCLVHWLYGGVYPRRDQEAMIAEFRRSGDLLPPVLDLGHVAVSGMTRYRGNQWGDAYRGNVFQTEFNTHKVKRITLTRAGATYRAAAEEFWTHPSPDCHPTDVLQDADGSLLVIDTGGWFRNGCPTSQIAKPEILGTIYRIRRNETVQHDDPRGLLIDWPAISISRLVELLDDPRPPVAGRAIAAVAARGGEGVGALATALDPSSSLSVRRHAIWALTRINSPAACAAVRVALADPDPAARLTAVASASTTRDAGAVDRLLELVQSDEPPVRREAATALGRIGDRRAAPALLEAARRQVDRALDHAIVYALIELNDPTATAAGLADSDDQVRRTALVALDQMEAGNLSSDAVMAALDTSDADLERAALEILKRRPQLAEGIDGRIGQWLTEQEASDSRQATARGALLGFLRETELQKAIAGWLSADLPRWSQRVLLEAIARSDLESLPEEWRKPLAQRLADGDGEQQSLALAAAAPHPELFHGELQAVVDRQAVPADTRLAAAAALARDEQALAPSAFATLMSALADTSPPLTRLQAAEALGAAELDAKQLAQLVAKIEQLGALELPAALRAFAKRPTPQLGDQLVAALADAPGLPSLGARRLEEALREYPAEVQQAAQRLVAINATSPAESQARLNAVLASLAPGSAERGRQLFFGAQAACSACHSVAGEGSNIGPDLSKIASIRTRRDLLEAVTLPSASFARGFESYAVATADGQVFTGVLRRESPEAIWLRLADRSEVRLPRAEIEEMSPATQSIMPEGLLNTMTPAQRNDLVAFLESLK